MTMRANNFAIIFGTATKRSISRSATAVVLLFVLAGGVAVGQRKSKSDPCANPLTQMEMNHCAGKAFQAADATINQVYRKLVSMLDEGEKAQLKEAQVAWLKYRDTNCEFVADQYKGGSIRLQIQATCLKDMTKARTTQLKAQIKERNL
jgi:uncharacterized protein YecT (DUF1311 family)